MCVPSSAPLPAAGYRRGFQPATYPCAARREGSSRITLRLPQWRARLLLLPKKKPFAEVAPSSRAHSHSGTERRIRGGERGLGTKRKTGGRARCSTGTQQGGRAAIRRAPETGRVTLLPVNPPLAVAPFKQFGPTAAFPLFAPQATSLSWG